MGSAVRTVRQRKLTVKTQTRNSMSQELSFKMEEEGGKNNMKFQKPMSKKKPVKSEGGDDLAAVPPHILRIMQQVEEKKKLRVRNEGQSAPDSVSMFKNLMQQYRTKLELDEEGDEMRQEKENDIARITNARDIFKTLEIDEDVSQPITSEKHKRVEVNTDFLLSGQNKAEEMRKARLKEMSAMRSAREMALEDETSRNRGQKQKADDIKRQRESEIEMMRMARQQAIEDEEREEASMKAEFKRQVSPGLEAARTVSFQQSRDPYKDSTDKIERMRAEREFEIMQMMKDRDSVMDDDLMERQDGRSEASRELEAFRASRQAGGVKERYQPGEEQQQHNGNDSVTRAPKSKVKSDNWMSSSNQEKQEIVRMQRAREIEMMMSARSQAIEEEEQERAMEDHERRLDAERKAQEMAMLVANLQRMREHQATSQEEEDRMTRYQEEMMNRVLELQELQRAGVMHC